MLFSLLILHAALGLIGVAFHRVLRRWGFALAAVPAAATLVVLASKLGQVLDGQPVTESVDWVPGLGLSFDLRLDAFAALMVTLVSGIGVLVCWYAIAYFSHPAPGTGRLAGLLTLFAGSMLGVVIADHVLTLFVFWELTTVTSYLLIGNDDRKRAARDSALMAVLITGAGGLVMLAGLIIVGQSAGTYRLSELAGSVPDTTLTSVGAICVLVGAFTKSAQFPFSAWLPGAMVAPTPISTYLHAATMVKAGVFLAARFAPALSDLAVWQPLIIGFGGVTMFVGGWRALRQFDLKLLLAHGTVSQLGFMMMLGGLGVYATAQAAAVLLIAHGAFKAALFMVVGIVDHQAGTRDVRRLVSLGSGWWPVRIIAIVAAASMAGFPPMLGFIGKEKALDAALHEQTALVIAIVAGSLLTVAYSGRFVMGLLGTLAEPDNPDHEDVTTASPPGFGFLAPAALLATFTLAAGLAPVMIDRLIRSATVSLYPSSDPAHVHLWAGFNTALYLSAAIIAGGGVLIASHRQVSIVQRRVHAVVDVVGSTDGAFWRGLRGVTAFAKSLTAILQNGSLPIYLMIILAVASLAPLGPALASLDSLPDVVDNPAHIPIAGLIIAAAFGAAIVRRRIAAALMLGAVGYSMAGFFVLHGAPDLALTQFAIETLATVLFVLVLRFLPKQFDDRRRPPVFKPLRLAIASSVAVSIFVFALVAADARSYVEQPSISDEMLARSVPDGKGSNVVNVILVDFRGLDTLGEVTVLVIAALGAVALARTSLKAPIGSGTGKTDTGFARLPVVSASTRVLFPSIIVLSLYFLFAGHNQPGGGFVGGLTAGAAISLRYVSGGVTWVRSTFRAPPWAILGAGLAVSVTTALVPLLAGQSVLHHSVFEQTFPLLGKVKTTTALPFDIGVYMVVIGLVLMAFEAFGDDVEPDQPEVAS